MKKIIIGFIALFFSSAISFAQTDIETYPTKSHLSKLPGALYSMTITDSEGDILQTGMFTKQDDTMIRHGLWKLYDVNTHELITKTEFVFGEQTWIETFINGQVIHYSKEEITINRLHQRLAKLEQKINS